MTKTNPKTTALFQRRHHEVIAKYLAEFEQEATDPYERGKINFAFGVLCSIFEQDNPKFDSAHFAKVVFNK